MRVNTLLRNVALVNGAKGVCRLRKEEMAEWKELCRPLSWNRTSDERLQHRNAWIRDRILRELDIDIRGAELNSGNGLYRWHAVATKDGHLVATEPTWNISVELDMIKTLNSYGWKSVWVG